VLQCVAVCCSVLQCVAVCCSVLQCVAVEGSVLQCVAVSLKVGTHAEFFGLFIIQSKTEVHEPHQCSLYYIVLWCVAECCN